MERVERCLICDSAALYRVPGEMTPSLRQRCAILDDSPISRCFCPDCDVTFYNARLDEGETARLRRHGREEARSPHETPSANPLADSRERSSKTRVMFKDWALPCHRVLVYGQGREARLSRTFFPHQDVETLDITTNRLHHLNGKADLVVCTDVLEHMSYPKPFLADLAGCVRPGGYLYLEVPMETPDGSLIGTLHAGHGLNVMQERQTQFTARALARLLLQRGFRPLDARTPANNALAILARRTGGETALELSVSKHERLPEHQLVDFCAALAYQAMGRIGNALHLLDQLLAQQPESAPFLNSKAGALAFLGDLAPTEAHFLAALNSDPTYPLTYIHFSRYLTATRQLNQAQACLEAGLDQNPGCYSLWSALLQYSEKYTPEKWASDAWDAVSALEHPDPAWFQCIIDALEKQGAHEELEKVRQRMNLSQVSCSSFKVMVDS